MISATRTQITLETLNTLDHMGFKLSTLLIKHMVCPIISWGTLTVRIGDREANIKLNFYLLTNGVTWIEFKISCLHIILLLLNQEFIGHTTLLLNIIDIYE